MSDTTLRAQSAAATAETILSWLLGLPDME